MFFVSMPILWLVSDVSEPFVTFPPASAVAKIGIENPAFAFASPEFEDLVVDEVGRETPNEARI
jgi:hypothetical protein